MPRRHMPDFLQGLWSSALSLCIINEQGFVEDANLAMCTTLGYSSQQLIGTDMMLLLAQGEAHKTRQLRQQFRDKRYAIAQGVWQLRTARSCHVPLRVLGSWITKHEGSLFKLVVMVHEACAQEGKAVLERHVLTDPRTNQPYNAPAHTTQDDLWPPPKSSPAAQPAATATDMQRLRQRVVMLEGQLSAYKGALERYKVPNGIHFEEGAWYVQLPETNDSSTNDSSTETPSDED